MARSYVRDFEDSANFEDAVDSDAVLGCEEGSLLNYEKFDKITNVRSLCVTINELINEGSVTENNISELCMLIDRWVDIQSLSYEEPKNVSSVLGSHLECLQQIQASLDWQNPLSDLVNDELELRAKLIEQKSRYSGSKPSEDTFTPQMR